MSDFKILGISGSLRADSYNSALLRAAQKFQPGGLDIEIYEGLRDIPRTTWTWTLPRTARRSSPTCAAASTRPTAC